MIDAPMNRSGFTLVEIIATMMLLAFGLVAVIGMVQYAARLSAESQTRATALITAQSVLADPEPGGLSADDSVDSDGDDWMLDGSFSDASFVVRGFINGYYVHRTEERDALVDNRHHMAWVTVQLFSNGQKVVHLKRRMLRRTVSQ